MVVLSALALHAGSAQAATRTYVNATTGIDGLGCTSRVPCATIQAAVNSTDPDGTVVITDSDTYGAVTITKSLSIIATGAHRPEIRAVQPVTVDPGASGDVTLQGIAMVASIHQVCFFGGDCQSVSSSAVNWKSGTLDLSGVSARSPLGDAVGCGSGALVALRITDSALSRSLVGIDCLQATAPPTIDVEHTTFRDDFRGIYLSQCASLSLDADLFLRSWTAVELQCLGVITHTRISSSRNYGIFVEGSGGGVYLSSSRLLRNSTAWAGNVVSYGDNMFIGNAHGDAPPPRVSYGR